MLQQAGFHVEAVAFDGNYYPGLPPDCPVSSLGRLFFKSYFLTIPQMLTRVFKIRSQIRHNDIVYAVYTEIGLAALVAGIGLAKPVVLEVHDIKPHQVARGPMGRLIRFVDGIVTRACRLLVLTTGNHNTYYRDWLHSETPRLVIEHKIDASFADEIRKKGVPAPTGKPLEDRPLRIGYFGILKDEWAFRVLELLTTSDPGKFEVVLAGTERFIENFPQRVAQTPNMEYRGTYADPDDLASLHGAVDMVMACYATAIPGCWAHSLRYYRACLFQNPLIVRARTGDAREVERHQIGLIVADDNVEDAAAAIRKITTEDWERWRANMAALPPRAYTNTNDDVRLGRALRKVADMDSSAGP